MMEIFGHDKPRASGKRMPFSELPLSVNDWMLGSFGHTEVVYEFRGGMSPGCATSVVTEMGHHLFVKAVEDNPEDFIAGLFRHEAHILETLPQVDYRPVLLDFFDDGEWVALVIDHVDGVYPDFALDNHLAAVAEALVVQAEELSCFSGELNVPSLQESVLWWVSRWEEVAESPELFLPDWATFLADEGKERVGRLLGALPDETVCHFDVRNDNLLIRENSSVTFLDWGIAMTGPRWVDLLMLSIQATDPEKSDKLLREWIPSHLQDLVTDFLVAFGGSQAWDSKLPDLPRVPTLRNYLKEDAERLLRVAEVRLA